MTTGDEARVNEIVRAANDAVVMHLDVFYGSSAQEQLWENHPELSEDDADKAAIQADRIATMLRDMLRLLAPADPALYTDDTG